MALAANKDTEIKETYFGSYTMKANTRCFAGGLVCVQRADSLAVPASDTAALELVGVATDEANNLTGATDPVDEVKVRRTGIVKVVHQGATAAAVGNTVYVVDDQTVSSVDTTNLVRAGVIVEVVSATSVWIDISKAYDGRGAAMFVTGNESVTGSLVVATGLTTIEACGVTLAVDASLDGDRVSATFANGNLTIKVWKPTGAADCTPIAAVVAKRVDWWVRGR